MYLTMTIAIYSAICIAIYLLDVTDSLSIIAYTLPVYIYLYLYAGQYITICMICFVVTVGDLV